MASIEKELTGTPEGKRAFEQERLILDVTELISATMDKVDVRKTDLARRLNRTKGYVTQLLDGRANMTLRTISDVMWALDHTLHVTVKPIEESQSSFGLNEWFCQLGNEWRAPLSSDHRGAESSDEWARWIQRSPGQERGNAPASRIRKLAS